MKNINIAITIFSFFNPEYKIYKISEKKRNGIFYKKCIRIRIKITELKKLIQQYFNKNNSAFFKKYHLFY